MEKRIKVFKTFEEQEEFAFKKMQDTTPMKRFEKLYRMQKITNLFKKDINTTRRIIIKKNGLT
jgi:PleD family two-component response regulator